MSYALSARFGDLNGRNSYVVDADYTGLEHSSWKGRFLVLACETYDDSDGLSRAFSNSVIFAGREKGRGTMGQPRSNLDQNSRQ